MAEFWNIFFFIHFRLHPLCLSKDRRQGRVQNFDTGGGVKNFWHGRGVKVLRCYKWLRHNEITYMIYVFWWGHNHIQCHACEERGPVWWPWSCHYEASSSPRSGPLRRWASLTGRSETLLLEWHQCPCSCLAWRCPAAPPSGCISKFLNKEIYMNCTYPRRTASGMPHITIGARAARVTRTGDMIGMSGGGAAGVEDGHDQEWCHQPLRQHHPEWI